MKGFKTVAFNLVMAAAVIAGVELDAQMVQDNLEKIAGAWAGINVIVRAFTNSPIFRRSTAIVLMLAAAAPMLVGCESLGYNARIAAFERGVVEPEVDAALEQVVSRLCRLPADIMVRAINKYGERVLIAAEALCPEWQQLMTYSAAAVARQGGMLSMTSYLPYPEILRKGTEP